MSGAGRPAGQRGVYASDAINLHLMLRGRKPVVTEQMLSFRCEQCGESVGAAEATIERLPEGILYRCPRDQAALLSVAGGELGKGGGDLIFQAGTMAVRAGEVELDWADFVDSR